MTEYTVALWYMRYSSPGYDLCETEEEAAGEAVTMEDSGTASVSGIQFADGRLVPIGRWRAYEARRRYDAEEAARDEQAARPPVAMREALDPFSRRPVKIQASEPAWLGLRPADREPS